MRASQKSVGHLRLGLRFHLHLRVASLAALITESTHNHTFSDHSNVEMLCESGRLKEALNVLHVVDKPPDLRTYLHLLQSCIQNEALPDGKPIHAHIIQTGFMEHKLLQNTLVNMYAKCEILADARKIFDQMPEQDVCSWTLMIAAYARHGPAEEALVLFNQMRETNVQPNKFTFASVLPACASMAALQPGMEIHKQIIRSGFEFDVVVANALIHMYAKCGSIDQACRLFDKMPQRDVVSWTTMVAGYAHNGFVVEALRFFMKMPQRNIVSWNAMIAGFVQNGFDEEALKLIREMQLASSKLNSNTFGSILQACINLDALEQGMEIHGKIIRTDFQSDIMVMNALIDMYAKCGSLKKASELFDRMPQRDVISWTTMIAGYAQNGFVDKALKLFDEMPQRNVISWNAMLAGFTQNGFAEEALELFQQMQLTGEMPDLKTFTSILPACANMAALKQGMEIHENIIRSGFQSDVFVMTALLDMYAQCERIEKALELFGKMHQRDLVSWNVMIIGYAQNGLVEEALKLFKEMPQRDVVSWNAMVAGFSQNGHGEKALEFFQQMQAAGIMPISKTFAIILPVCANLGALEQAIEMHGNILRSGFQLDVTVVNALVHMYAKCGSIKRARKLFDKMHHQDEVSWNAMIEGYAMHGHGKEALNLFEEMKHSGMNPNHATFVSVLSACSHVGLVEEGYHYFNSMTECFHLMPAMEHHICMVDLLGRAGHLDEAQDFINKMPIKPDAVVWNCLLAACRIHSNIELGERVADHLLELEPESAAPYVLMSNIYAAAGRWSDIKKVRKVMKDRGLKKVPGCSWIEIDKVVHAFVLSS